MESIKNYETYNEEMHKSLKDKLFFLDKIEGVENLVDFGCADGNLLKAVSDLKPEINLYGIDSDAQMLDKAKQLLDGKLLGYVNSKHPMVLPGLDASKSALNISSVIHEVYSYCTPEEIDEFWDGVNNSGYKYIIIRDMIRDVPEDRASDPMAYQKLKRFVLEKADEDLKKRVDEFEDAWGSLKLQHNMIHFFLKYRYVYNWDREVKENYIPLGPWELLDKLDLDKYELVETDVFTLPFLAEQVEKDFGIELNNNTHIKVVLKRKGE